MSKRIITILLAVAVSVFFAQATEVAYSRHSSAVTTVTVVIDPGHGGIDNGAIGKVLKANEAEINLAVAKKLKKRFDEVSVNAVLTRSNALGLYGILSPGFKSRDLRRRVQITKESNADVFISIHMNNFPSANERGSRVFFRDDEKSMKFASLVQRQLNAVDGDNRQSQAAYGDYFVLNNQDVPSILCECGFLSNAQDEARLLTDEYQQVLASAIFDATINFLYSQSEDCFF